MPRLSLWDLLPSCCGPTLDPRPIGSWGQLVESLHKTIISILFAYLAFVDMSLWWPSLEKVTQSNLGDAGHLFDKRKKCRALPLSGMEL